MSVSTTAFVWELNVNPTMKFVLLAIAEGCADSFGFKEAATIASQKTGYDIETTVDAFNFATGAGLIERVGNMRFAFVCDAQYQYKPNNQRHSLSHLIPSLAARDNSYKCAYCGCDFIDGDTKRRPTVDHIMPSSRGGSDDPDNLILACFSCNAQKGDKTAEEYKAWLAVQL